MTAIALDNNAGRLTTYCSPHEANLVAIHACISEFFPRIRIPSAWATPTTTNPDDPLHLESADQATVGRMIRYTANTSTNPLLDVTDHDLLPPGDPGITVVNLSPRSTIKTRQKHAVLWRIVRNPDHVDTLYILSGNRPSNLDHVLPNAVTQQRKYPPGYPCTEPGDELRIEVVLSPMLKTEGRRIAITDGRRRTQWACELLERQAGFTIDPTQKRTAWRHAYRTDGFRHASQRVDGKLVSVTLSTFVGIGTVTNPTKFGEAVRNGVGSGRAYGAGMILASRILENRRII